MFLPPNVGSVNPDSSSVVDIQSAREAKTASKDTATGEATKKKKPQPPSVELRFSKYLLAESRFRIGGRMEEGGLDQSLYCWNDEYWELQYPEQTRKIALDWLQLFQPSECSRQMAQRAANTAVDMMTDEANQSVMALERSHSDCAIIPVNGAYLCVDAKGIITPVKPAKEHGVTYSVPSTFDWSRVADDGTYVPRPLDPASRFGQYLERFMPDPGIRGLLQEATAVSILPINLEVAFVLTGDGSNGKSTFLHLLRALHPANTAIRVQEASSRFGFQNVQGKTLVIAAEVPDFIGKSAEQNLKSLISRDPIEVEKKQKDSVCIVPRCTLFFAINEAIKFSDHTYGSERKYENIPFHVRLMKDSPDRISEFHKLIIDSPAEMSAFLDWVLEGAARVMRQGNLSPRPDSVNEFTRASRLTTDNVAAFLDDRNSTFAPELKTDTMDIYTAYVEYCSARTNRPVAAESFWKRVREMYRRDGHELGSGFWGTDENGVRRRGVHLSIAGIAPRSKKSLP